MTIEAILKEGENERAEFKTSFNSETIETLVAFANTKGGKVYIGISDNAKILGVTILKETLAQWVNEIKNKTSPILYPDVELIKEENKEIVVLSIQEYPIKPVSFRGKYFKRVLNSNQLMSTNNVADMHLQTFNTSWDYHLDLNHEIDNISLEKVQNAIDIINRSENKIYDDPLTFLMKHDLVRDGKITHAALLLFNKNESVITTIELGRFQTDIIIKDSDRTKDDILTQIDRVLDFVKKHINKEIIITGSPLNTEKWQYPLEAIREIIMNMIVHRDYRSSSDSIVKIYNNKIEFYNPGRLPENITVDDLMANTYKSTPRNKLLADFFKNLGLIEKYGSGIQRVVNYFASENLPVPQFRNISEGFMVTVFSGDVDAGIDNNIKNVTVNVTNNVTDNVTVNRAQFIVNELKINKQVSIVQLAEKFNVTKRTIIRDINNLKRLNIVKRNGPDKGGYWEVRG